MVLDVTYWRSLLQPPHFADLGNERLGSFLCCPSPCADQTQKPAEDYRSEMRELHARLRVLLHAWDTSGACGHGYMRGPLSPGNLVLENCVAGFRAQGMLVVLGMRPASFIPGHNRPLGTSCISHVQRLSASLGFVSVGSNMNISVLKEAGKVRLYPLTTTCRHGFAHLSLCTSRKPLAATRKGAWADVSKMICSWTTAFLRERSQIL